MKKILLLMVGFLSCIVAQAYTDVYLRGTMSGNFDAQEAWKMETTDGVTYTKTGVNISKGQQFKIADADWGDINYGWTDNTINVGSTAEQTLYYKNNQFGISEDLVNAKITFKVTEPKSQAVIKIENNYNGGDNPGTKYQIKSAIDGSDWPLHDMVDDGTGKYVYTYENVTASSSSRGMGMMIDDKWRGSTQSAKTFNGSTLTCKMDATGGNDIMVAGSYTGSILCSYDPATNNLTLSDPSQNDDSYRLHIHTMVPFGGKQIYPFDVTGESPYSVTLNITAPLADELPLCIHYRHGADDYVSYGFSEATTYVPEGDGKTGDLVSFSDASKYITLPKGLQGNVTFEVSVTDGVPSSLKISGGQIAQSLYTYILWDNFNSNELQKTQTLTPHVGHFDAKYTFTGEEKGRVFKVERLLNGQTVTGRRWGIIKDSPKYVPSETGVRYEISATGVETVVFPEDLRGTVTISVYVDEDGVPDYFRIQGGHIGDGPDDTYTIYFYDTTAGGTQNDPYAYMWRKEAGDNTSEFTKWWGDDKEKGKMTATGRYVVENGNYYPLYSLSFSWESLVPHNVIIHNGDTHYTQKDSNPLFVNGGYYYTGCSAAKSASEVTVTENANVTFYMHWKQDWLKDGNGEAPRCFVFSGTKPSNIKDAWDNGVEMSQITDLAPSISTFSVDAHGDEEVAAPMTITEKYQIWKAEMTPAQMSGKTDVMFVLKHQKDDGSFEYWDYGSRSGGFAEPSFLSKYIFATASENNSRYAVQTYLPYEDFVNLDRQGRPHVYLVGDANGAIQGLQWDNVALAKEFTPEQGVFYIKIDVTGNTYAKFKMSWISVQEAIERNSIVKIDNQRSWATFDLGIIGFDDTFSKYPEGYERPKVEKADAGDLVSAAWIKPYQSLPYMNYNQYNWYIPAKNITRDAACHLVIDPHSTCRTVTLIPYDPNPSVDVVGSSVGQVSLNEVQARQLHGDHSAHLNGAASNGHIYMDRINVCSGSVKINPSDGLSIGASGFKLLYSIYMNGNEVMEIPTPGEYNINFLPLASSADMDVRCKYTNHATGLTFHSKLGSGTVTTPDIEFPQPEASIENATYIIDSRNGVSSVGVLLRPLRFNVTTEHAYFADFSFEIGEKAELLHKDHRMVKMFASLEDDVLPGWEFIDADNNYDFSDARKNDWSTKLAANKSAYVLLTDVSVENFEAMDVSGMVRAVYPFIYQLKPELTPVSPARKRVGSATALDLTLPDDLSGFAISNMAMTQPVSTSVSGVISGVENVEADALEGDAEYYNLQGIRVYGEPAPGIYLLRQGGKVSKVLVR